MYRLIGIKDICSSDYRLAKSKTYRFMVGYTVSQNIYAVKLIEKEGVIVLERS